MKQFFKWLGKHIAGAMVFSLFSILFILGIVYALSYPSAPPVGEVAGGKFMQYFNSIKVACPNGQYLNGYDANFNKVCAVAMTGATGVPWSTGPIGNTGATGPTNITGGLAASIWWVISDGTLWDGTMRCVIKGTVTGCIRINNNKIETKMTDSTINSGWVTGLNNTTSSASKWCNAPNGNNSYYTWKLSATTLYPVMAPLSAGCSASTAPAAVRFF